MRIVMYLFMYLCIALSTTKYNFHLIFHLTGRVCVYMCVCERYHTTTDSILLVMMTLYTAKMAFFAIVVTGICCMNVPWEHVVCYPCNFPSVDESSYRCECRVCWFDCVCVTKIYREFLYRSYVLFISKQNCLNKLAAQYRHSC